MPPFSFVDNLEKYSSVGQATDDNMALRRNDAIRMPNNQAKEKKTLIIFNSNFFLQQQW
jgi:hypothetical protein